MNLSWFSRCLFSASLVAICGEAIENSFTVVVMVYNSFSRSLILTLIYETISLMENNLFVTIWAMDSWL